MKHSCIKIVDGLAPLVVGLFDNKPYLEKIHMVENALNDYLVVGRITFNELTIMAKILVARQN